MGMLTTGTWCSSATPPSTTSPEAGKALDSISVAGRRSGDGALAEAVLQAVHYADIFDYPLRVDEIHRALTASSPRLRHTRAAMAALLQQGELACGRGFYHLPGRENLVAIRQRRASIAVALWREAPRYGRLIAALPFVRMVAVTGALAVENTEPDDDIDLLIVTTPGRLWLCRLLVILVVLCARWRGRTLCPNYLLTTSALALREQSLFTARELLQMVPLFGPEVYEQMLSQNRWIQRFQPQARPRHRAANIRLRRAAASAKAAAEWLLRQRLFDRLERWEMARKVDKFERLAADRGGSVRFGADECKGHFEGHDQRILAEWRWRLGQLDNPGAAGESTVVAAPLAGNSNSPSPLASAIPVNLSRGRR